MKRKSHTWFNYLVCLGLALSFTFFSFLPSVLSLSSPPPVPPKSSELRGVWLTNVSSSVLFAPWGVNRAINRLAKLHFNTIYPVVWNRGHTFYPSQVAQQIIGRSEDPWLNFLRIGSDVLDEIVKVSHQRHISVIPWFEYGLITPANSPLAKRHPDWLTQRRDQVKVVSAQSLEQELTNPSTDKGAKGLTPIFKSLRRQLKIQQVWLNPFHPQVQQFIKDLILEVVVYYDVDGIQLDDHFGIPVAFGYDSYTVKLYQKEHHGKKPPDNPFDPEWMRWRANKLTAFMTKIVQAVRAVRPEVKISLSPNAYQFSYNRYLQDWQTWVQKGLIDELILQVYRKDLKSFQAELNQNAVQLARRRLPVSVGISTGTWNSPVDIKQIQQQVKIVRDRGFKGVSFFYWETLWGYITPDSPHQRRSVFQSIFPHATHRPNRA